MALPVPESPCRTIPATEPARPSKRRRRSAPRARLPGLRGSRQFVIGSQLAVRAVAGQLARPMPDRQIAAQMAAHLHPDLGVGRPAAVRRQLQDLPFEPHAVVPADRALADLAENVVQPRQVRARNERRSRLAGRPGELRVEGRQVHLPHIPVGRVDFRDPRRGQLLRQAPLVGAEGALRAAPRLRRIRRDHLDAEPRHRPSELRRVLLVHLAPRRRRVPVVRAPVRVQRAKQAPPLDRLPHSPKAAPDARAIQKS